MLHSSQYRDGEDWGGKRATRDRHRQQRPRHRAGPLVERRRGHAGPARSLDGGEHRAERAARLRAVRRGAAARGLRPDRHLDAVRARAQEPHRCSPNRAGSSTSRCSMGSRAPASGSTSATDGSGWQFKYLTRGGGYYFNVGCSDLIAEAKIALAQFSDIESFVAEGARMRSGETHRGRPDRAFDRLQDAGSTGATTVRRRGRGARRADLGLRRRSRSCATPMCAPRSPGSGSSAAASRSAASIRNISACRSRRRSWACCRADIAARGHSPKEPRSRGARRIPPSLPISRRNTLHGLRPSGLTVAIAPYAARTAARN